MFFDDGLRRGINIYWVKAVMENGVYCYFNFLCIGYLELLAINVFLNLVWDVFMFEFLEV